MTKREQPTRAKLIATVIQLLETANPEQIKVDEVLGRSGISVGSLYHHFTDIADLIDQAMVARYTADVDVSIAALSGVVDKATDVPSLLAGFRETTARTQSPNRGGQRFIRAQTMSRAVSSDRFRAALAPEQQRLTNAIAELWRSLQDKGLFDDRVDARAGSIFIQAYSLGLIVNDVSDDPVDADAYVELILRMLEKSFLVE